MVPGAGVEPAQDFSRGILSLFPYPFFASLSYWLDILKSHIIYGIQAIFMLF